MPKSPESMFTTMLAKLPEKTGRPLEEWVPLLQAQPLHTRKERIAWLQQQHGLTGGYARVITEKAIELESGITPLSPEQLLDAQYSGVKAALRPVYDHLAAVVRTLGNDVTLDPRKTYVAVNRAQQFALIQPTNRSRVDLGLRLRGIATTERLEEAPGFGSGSITHRVALACPEDIDGQVLGWLRAAYVTVR